MLCAQVKAETIQLEEIARIQEDIELIVLEDPIDSRNID